MACRLTQTAARRSVVSRAGLRVVAASAKPSKRSNDRATQTMQVATVATMASTMLAGSAQAAQQVAEVAGNDSRATVLLTLFVPAIGWVLFNIAGPALNQVSDMDKKNKSAVVAGLGLGATLLAAGSAQAASEVAQLAGGDNRTAVLLTLFVPAIAWVLFNIAGPALNQVSDMDKKNKSAVVAGLGLGASLLAAGSADAAQQVATLAGGDNRTTVLLALFVPAIAWVLFNIAGPALNQVSDMDKKNKSAVVAGLGLGATLLAAGSADAAQQVATLAGNDSRATVLLTLFVPAIGWVLFNIAGPALNQVSDMDKKNKA